MVGTLKSKFLVWNHLRFNIFFEIFFSDKEFYSDAIYAVNYIYQRDGKRTSVTVQFRQKRAPNIAIDFPPKVTKKEQFYISIDGLDTITIQNYQKCFGPGGILLGVMDDELAEKGQTNWAPCVAWQKTRI